jgi:hypothetical protein
MREEPNREIWQYFIAPKKKEKKKKKIEMW